MPQGCIQMFSCDFFSIFSQVRGPFCVTKSAGLGPWPPWHPLKPPLVLDVIVWVKIAECSILENEIERRFNVVSLFSVSFLALILKILHLRINTHGSKVLELSHKPI